MELADEKEVLATIFFECARYERPSTEWIAALDIFVEKVAETEREACAKPLCLENSPFENRGAQLLHAAWIDGWASCHNAEFIGEEAMNDAFNSSLTLAMCLATDHAK